MPPKKPKSSSPDYPLLARQLVEATLADAACKPAGGLYLVATPIGHRGDITLRALATLAAADLIACEDTRTSGTLLQAYGVKKRLLSYHDHNADERRPELMRRLKTNEVIALISDAGMPAIADPGFKLVRECRESGINVTVIPGANAALTAIAGSGLPTDHFYFAGFLPAKSAARKKQIAALKTSQATLIFYESPQRLCECLADLAEILGEARPAAVTRELTKLHEETRRGSLGELAAFYAKNTAKGEIVLIVGGNEGEIEATDIDALLAERLKHLSVRDATAEIAEMTGQSKKEIYARALTLSMSGK